MKTNEFMQKWGDLSDKVEKEEKIDLPNSDIIIQVYNEKSKQILDIKGVTLETGPSEGGFQPGKVVYINVEPV